MLPPMPYPDVRVRFLMVTGTPLAIVNMRNVSLPLMVILAPLPSMATPLPSMRVGRLELIKMGLARPLENLMVSAPDPEPQSGKVAALLLALVRASRNVHLPSTIVSSLELLTVIMDAASAGAVVWVALRAVVSKRTINNKWMWRIMSLYEMPSFCQIDFCLTPIKIV